MMDVYILKLLIFALFTISLCTAQTANQTSALVNDVLRNYDKRIRPKWNQSRPTIVSAYSDVLNIEEFNEVEGRFSVSVLLYLGWVNDLIRWDPADYGGIKSHMFSKRDVWHPELVIGYQTGMFNSYVKDWMEVRIYHYGLSLLTVISLFQSTCSVDIKYYPFDTQECELVLVPIGYEIREISLEAPIDYVMTRFYTEHGSWELIGTSSVGKDGGLKLIFKMKRKPLFFVMNIILPIMLMSVLSSLIFALPPQSGERVSYGITVLLAIAVFLSIVGENLPKTSSPMSFLSYYLMFNLVTSTLMCIAAILNLRLYFYDGDDQIPIWAHCVIRITCTGTCGRRKEEETKKMYEADSQSRSLCVPIRNDARTWMDVSRAVDKLCFVCSLSVTVMSIVGFILVIANRET